ncbi:MAG: LysM peptidoglycan-binding domain-containing protein [Deltaproteobacteria bacterium]|nr:LysM peptidoglycan-binding domain-containing protein [Deltaproteobacteria bacterium]MCP5007174.1 LysM peptidoglycan-binding domain-containing protein [Planctomycetota bacterium]
MKLKNLTISSVIKGGVTVEAMYNPNELTISTRNKFQRAAMPGLPTPVTQFVSGETQTISLNLFFDTYEKGEDVRDYTSKVMELLKIDRKLHAPPVCKFDWGGSPISGDKKVFRGVIDSVSQKFTMFLDGGTPVRATLAVSISEYKTIAEQVKLLDLQSADRTKHRIFKQGDSLWFLAHNEYGDPAKWRVIADANKIENPLDISPGTELVLPPLE